MINDNQTNKVYLAEGLRHYEEAYKNILNALYQNRIHSDLLPKTESYKHVWARDYMPIQLEKDRFLLYEYQPDYLDGYPDYIPNYRAIARKLHLNCSSTDIVLDGGNVVRCGDKVIMARKVIKENPKYEEKELLTKLEEMFGAQVVLISWDRNEMFGHSDGMVRYISGNRVLLNNYADYDPKLRQILLEDLAPHFIVEELAYGTPRCNKLSWAYLNFLQTKSCIFVPGLHAKEDPLALEQIQMYYPDYEVIQIQGCEHIARDGGALNCISWNILTDVPEWPREEA